MLQMHAAYAGYCILIDIDLSGTVRNTVVTLVCLCALLSLIGLSLCKSCQSPY